MCRELLDGQAEHWLYSLEVDLKRAFVLGGVLWRQAAEAVCLQEFLKVEAAHVCVLGGCGVGMGWGSCHHPADLRGTGLTNPFSSGHPVS